MRKRLSLVFALLFLCNALLVAQPVKAMTREARARALMATVLIVVPDSSGRPYSSGSGTIMDAEGGYILSNYHVIGDIERGSYYNKDGVAVIGVPHTMARDWLSQRATDLAQECLAQTSAAPVTCQFEVIRPND